MGEMMKFAEMQSESRPVTRHERAFLARFDESSKWVQSARVIFNEMLICSARP